MSQSHKKAVKQIANNNVSKAMSCLTNLPFVKPAEHIEIKLKQLHPERAFEIPKSVCNFIQKEVDLIEFDVDEVRKIIFKQSKQKCPGLSKYRSEHIQQLIGSINDQEGERFLRVFTTFLSKIANDNKLPTDVNSFLNESILFTLRKDKIDETKIRPIAVGDTFMKIVSKLILQSNFVEIDLLMGKLQQGVGRKFAVEQIVHLVNFVKNNPKYAQWDLLCIDFENAFNTISRAKILSQTLKFFPNMLPYVRKQYNAPSALWYTSAEGDVKSMMSREGCRQGDPLSPFLFALATLPLFTEAAAIANNNFLNDNKTNNNPKTPRGC
jgi:hypothetical protein